MESCLKAFITIKGNLSLLEHQGMHNIIRQLLFGNLMILEEEGIPLGMGENHVLHLWARKGITKILDVWNKGSEFWLSSKQI